MITKNTHRFEFKLGRIGVLLFLLGMTGLLFGVFLLGVTLGKNIDTYPEKIARFLPDRIKTRIGLSPDVTEPVIAARDEKKQDTPEPEQDVNLTFYETLGKRKTDTKGMLPDGMIQKKASPEKLKEVPFQSPPASVMPGQMIQSKAAATPPVAKKAESAKEKPGQQEKFLVQVVSYQDKGKAEGLAKKISASGYPVQTEVMELPGKGKWFRVVMGTFSNRPQAQKAIDSISKKNKGLNCVIRSVGGNGN
jgi:cell division protein FtsN